MERKIVRQLKKWKTLRDRKPLILNGARQVGKVYSALSFGKEYYKIAVYFNFDEIQTCGRAFTSLKYFNENASECHIIAAGSLLGVALNREEHSFPVYKVDMLTLYPLYFEELLWAMNKNRWWSL